MISFCYIRNETFGLFEHSESGIKLQFSDLANNECILNCLNIHSKGYYEDAVERVAHAISVIDYEYLSSKLDTDFDNHDMHLCLFENMNRKFELLCKNPIVYLEVYSIDYLNMIKLNLI